MTLFTSSRRPVWPDLAKFRHFDKILKIFRHLLRAKIIFGNIFDILWQIIYVIGQTLIVANGQILNT